MPLINVNILVYNGATLLILVSMLTPQSNHSLFVFSYLNLPSKNSNGSEAGEKSFRVPVASKKLKS